MWETMLRYVNSPVCFYMTTSIGKNRRAEIQNGDLTIYTCPLSTFIAGVEICRSFNAWGCQREACKYVHVCSLCKEAHPRSRHDNPYPQPPPPGERSTGSAGGTYLH